MRRLKRRPKNPGLEGSGESGVSDATPPRNPGTADSRSAEGGLRRKLAKALFALDPVEIQHRLAACEAATETMGRSLEEAIAGARELRREMELLRREVELLRDERVPALEARSDTVEDALRAVQDELARLRDTRLPGIESRLDGAERHMAETVEEVGILRDERLPAAVARQDALVERLAREQDEIASLVERMLQHEALPVPQPSAEEERLAEALAGVQPALVHELRGAEEEIAHRLQRYLPVLRDQAPVLDLGSGRGELLLLLREAGVEAVGIEGDPALATAAMRRGLRVRRDDVLAAVRGEKDGSWGAVTAVHLLEHLQPAVLLELLAQVRRILRDDGILIAECPNPHSLRVGAALFWLDPTHARPLLPETLELFLRASGFAIERVDRLHPFPDSQRFFAGRPEPGGAGDTGRRLARLEERLDATLNGFRDFSIIARKTRPQPGDTETA